MRCGPVLERYASPHEWWRIATLRGGEPVGFVIPTHNGYNPATPSNAWNTLRYVRPGVVDGVCLFAAGGAFGKPGDNLLAMLARSITNHLLELV